MKTFKAQLKISSGQLMGAVFSCALALPFLSAPVIAQSPPSRLQGPVLIEDDRDAKLRKEQFRRQAAEHAQKQLERLADQLRDQLGKEIAARQAAEAKVTELLTRAALEEQIDQERRRLRNEKTKVLEERRQVLERQVETLTTRLADERRSPRKKPTSNLVGEISKLKALVRQLERKLNAAEWARKLAEAQLKAAQTNPQ